MTPTREYAELQMVLGEANGLSPKEATIFLLNFDFCWHVIVGREPMDAERMIVSARLRKVAQRDP